MKTIELGRKGISIEQKKARYCQLDEDGNNKICKVKDIKKGDVFMIYEEDGTLIHYDGYVWFIAYKNSSKQDKDGLYNTNMYSIYDKESRLNFWKEEIR